MHYLETIKQEIEKTLKGSFGLENVNFAVGFPETLEHGDVTTNVCLVASKLAGKSPKEVGEILLSGLEKLKDSSLSFVEKYEQVGPGFINIWLKKEIVQSEAESKILDEVDSGKDDVKFLSKKYYGKRVLVEHTSINLFKPFGIGHMMTNFTGEFIYRITKFVGADAINLSYPSDKSIGIAKAVYSIKKDGGLQQDIFSKSLFEIVKYLGESYVKGVNEYKQAEENNNSNVIREVKDIANNIYNNTVGQDLEVFEFSKNKNIEYFKSFAKKLGSDFENFIYESEAGVEGKKIVLDNTEQSGFIAKLLGGKKIFKRSEGAIIYTPDENRNDISTSVFINSEGNPTYLAKDIGLLNLKFKKYNPDLSIFVTDNEQIPHFKSVLDAGRKIEKQWEEKSVHVSHGRMTFKGKKMSSRLGGVPSGEEVINAVLDEVKEKAGNEEGGKNRFEGMSVEEIESLQKEIALSALRVAILRSKPGVNIDFDPDRSLSFEGDSGPYLCYTHARCCSLLEKGKGLDLGNGEIKSVENNIVRKIFQFEKIVVEAAEEIAPQKLIKYLFEVAGEFNNFYAHNKIIDENDLEKTKYNLYLTKLVQTVLKRGLYLIGVKAPIKM